MFENLKHIDHFLFYAINNSCANPVFDFVCPYLRERLFWIPLYLFLAWYFVKTYKSRAIWLLVLVVVTIVLSDQVSSSLIKPFFHRLRPCNDPAMASTVRLLIANCGAGYSFVSSHAANHFGIASFLLPLVPRRSITWPLLFLWASAVSLSQIYVGVHFPADIACGALLGIAIGLPLGFAAKSLVNKQ